MAVARSEETQAPKLNELHRLAALSTSELYSKMSLQAIPSISVRSWTTSPLSLVGLAHHTCTYLQAVTTGACDVSQTDQCGSVGNHMWVVLQLRQRTISSTDMCVLRVW